jgi:hypothetical protein
MTIFSSFIIRKIGGVTLIIAHKTCPVYLFFWKLKTVKWGQRIHRIVSGTYWLYSKPTDNKGHTFQYLTASIQLTVDWQHRHETFTRILSGKLKWRNHLNSKLRCQDSKMNPEETRQDKHTDCSQLLYDTILRLVIFWFHKWKLSNNQLTKID